mmetsp:Transcript_11901/g.31988  ORF Transcript_11901/g.31988 Transcript_11901/m.31988 type:complete len:230 (+) Transcript_11901:3-692(+)
MTTMALTRLLLALLLALASVDALTSKAPASKLSRRDATKFLSAGVAVCAVPLPVFAGASSDLKTDRVAAYKKYQPRIAAGINYWKSDLPKQVASKDYAAITAALSVSIDPKDKKQKRKVYGPLVALFSPMELWASSFSRGAQRTEETLAMLSALDDFKAATVLLEEAGATQVKDSGLLGIFGAKKEPSGAERERNARQGLEAGTKALNAYIDVLNTQLKSINEDPVPRV